MKTVPSLAVAPRRSCLAAVSEQPQTSCRAGKLYSGWLRAAPAVAAFAAAPGRMTYIVSEDQCWTALTLKVIFSSSNVGFLPNGHGLLLT